jgi:hypothetical protein
MEVGYYSKENSSLKQSGVRLPNSGLMIAYVINVSKKDREGNDLFLLGLYVKIRIIKSFDRILPTG